MYIYVCIFIGFTTNLSCSSIAITLTHSVPCKQMCRLFEMFLPSNKWSKTPSFVGQWNTKLRPTGPTIDSWSSVMMATRTSVPFMLELVTRHLSVLSRSRVSNISYSFEQCVRSTCYRCFQSATIHTVTPGNRRCYSCVMFSVAAFALRRSIWQAVYRIECSNIWNHAPFPPYAFFRPHIFDINKRFAETLYVVQLSLMLLSLCVRSMIRRYRIFTVRLILGLIWS